MKKLAAYMGFFALLLNLFSCSGNNSSFKPGVLSKAGYYKEGDQVYYYGGFGNASVTLLKDADATQLETLEKRFPEQQFAHLYASDGTRVYFEGKLIKGADGKAFTIIGYGFGKDHAHVYAFHSAFSDDPAHYEDAKGGLFKDRKHVYEAGRIVSDNPAGLKYLGSSELRSYHSDKYGVMSGGIRINGADPGSFQPLAHNYSNDSKTVFLIDEGSLKTLEGADPATFEVLSPYYSKDAAHVFWRNLKLPGADPASFKITSAEQHRSRDKWRSYEKQNPLPVQ